MNGARHQRGFLLIVAVILIVVAATMAAVIVTLTAGSGQAGAENTDSARAFFVAESGLEKGIRQRSLDNTYAGEGPTTSGPGTFTVSVFSTDYDGATALAAGLRRIRSVGQVGSATRTVEAIVRPGATMMVYAREDDLGRPYFRQWDNETSSWGAEQQANDVGPEIFFMVLKFARTRNEAILGVQDTNGEITVQIWNGSTATWSAPTQICDAGGGSDDYRGFDIEYENTTDRAVYVCNNNNADEADWGTWDGTTLSAGGTVALGSIGDPLWIEMAPNPLGASDEIALIALGSNTDVCGTRWNGSAWVAMGCDWDASAATDTRKVIDVAYEQLSGRAMYIWGDNNNGEQYYRIWDGTTSTLSATTLLDLGSIAGPDMNGTAEWVRLVPSPTSNELMYGVQDDNSDLFTAYWDGTAWGSEIRHDGGVEDRQHRNFDIVFETHPTNAGEAWLLWGDGGGVSRKQWSGGAWGGTSNPAGDDDTALVQLAAHPSSGVVWSAIYEDGAAADPGQIFDMHLINGGGTWSGLTSIWGGDTEDNTVHERAYIAPERYTPIRSWREVFP